MEAGDAARAVDLDQIGIGRVIVGVEQQRRVRARRLVRGEHVRHVDVEQRVAVDDEEPLLQPIEAGERRARRAARIAVVDQVDGAAEVTAREEIGDLIGGMVDQHHDMTDAVPDQRADLAFEQRNAADVDQRLGPSPQPLGEARALAAGEDDRLHQKPSCPAISSTARRIASSDPSAGAQPVCASRSTE